MCPTHLPDLLTNPDNLPKPTDNLPEPKENLPEPSDNLPEPRDNLSHYSRQCHRLTGLLKPVRR